MLKRLSCLLTASAIPVWIAPSLLILGASVAGVASLSGPVRAQAVPDVGASPLDTSYLLGPGDQIEIIVFDYSEFTGRKVVLPDGTIALPLVGLVPIAGRTPAQVAQDLTARLGVWVRDPVVSVDLVKLRPVRVNVAGEVQRPGPLQLNNVPDITTIGNEFFELPTLSSALLKAGGITKNADIRAIQLVRAGVVGGTGTQTINLLDAVTSNASRDLLLRDGDSIFVPRLNSDEEFDRRLIARSSIAPLTVRVRVVGEVKIPGEKAVPPGSSLSSAIAIAGGPTPDAKLNEVSFIRVQEDGRVEEQRLDLSTLTDNFQIEEGDVIVVPTTRTATRLNTANRLSGPASAVMQFIQLIRLLLGGN
ncbi:polysaccharide export protein [Desertifilum sp. FACHB-1129]|uniref:Polysaccharide export protein n=1 Tax=Desertifilum tharense IPPAS B-1220 TaxID=1781255 RepID=A0A1E5QP62_9CYAN|nr:MULTISPECIES: polysaccharide biosynthesis/export family protein [Desertifilum]MDA0210658.1 polysaccharide export protein [Cyanobacteria bacterium FC1]MBD2312930.1 polysaccharide export protein [Desertifilum sp. FACHB-1129]MBD2323807.1 polysaccharide export protein [Desertifilum sp. FACHB-866]MBD2333652.1 polysaccharide export protein [Desertifilum sp. FACHB-868]OEJ76438.1 hypothetical protein BH720_04510 [Desertifilum tharense IPPAS B-1220]